MSEKLLKVNGVTGTLINTYTGITQNTTWVGGINGFVNYPLPAKRIWQIGFRIENIRNVFGVIFMPNLNRYPTYKDSDGAYYHKYYGEYYSYYTIAGYYMTYHNEHSIIVGDCSQNGYLHSNIHITVVFDFDDKITTTYFNGLEYKTLAMPSYFIRDDEITFSVEGHRINTEGEVGGYWEVQDGSPNNPIIYPIEGIPSIYKVLNQEYHDIYENNNNLYAIEKGDI